MDYHFQSLVPCNIKILEAKNKAMPKIPDLPLMFCAFHYGLGSDKNVTFVAIISSRLIEQLKCIVLSFDLPNIVHDVVHLPSILHNNNSQ